MIFTADDLRHTALVDELAVQLEAQIGRHDVVVRSAVLATLLARYLADYSPSLRHKIFLEHVALVDGLLELFEHQAAGRSVQ